jgi:hypothetical protein
MRRWASGVDFPERSHMEILKNWTVSLMVSIFLMGTASSSSVLAGYSSGPPTGCSSKQTSTRQTRNNGEVVEEAPEPSDPQTRASRLAKNMRYNIGGRNLTVASKNLGPDEEEDRFVEHYWLSGAQLFPTSESAIVVLGTLSSAQPYLSEDRSNIYTELTLRVDEILKNDSASPVAPNTSIVADLQCGALRRASGQVVRLDIPNRGPGRLRPGQRYLLFVRRIHEGKDLAIVTGFELRQGQVYGLRSNGGVSFESLRGVPENLMQTHAFLEAVRQAVKNPSR